MDFNKRKISALLLITTHFRALLIVFGIMALLLSCVKDDNFEVDNPSNPSNPTSQLDADKISEHFVLKNAIKITGDLPTAINGQIQTDVKDTIFLVKGYPIGNRIRFKHDPAQKISGFYIKVGLASYFFDVPKDYIEDQYVPLEENDSIAVLVLDLDLSTENVEYPFTTDFIIQPHDDSGMPIDVIVRPITVEDPNDANGVCNDIRRSVSPANHLVWEWDFTIREYNGQILNTLAPGLAIRINSQGAGCCSGTGISYSVSDHPGCVPNVNTSDMQWVELELDDFVVRTYEVLWFWDDGTYVVAGWEKKKTYDRAHTNFCTEIAAYTDEESGYGTLGVNSADTDIHDFNPGANHINLSRTYWEGGYRLPASADLIYTCHTLLLSWGNEDNWTSVYRKLDRNPTGFDSLFRFWYE